MDRIRLHDAIRAQHAAALHSVGLIADEAAVDAHLPPPITPTGPYRSQGSLQDAFRRATALAKARQVPLTSRDVLLAALDAHNGVVLRALAKLGVDIDVVRQQAANS